MLGSSGLVPLLLGQLRHGSGAVLEPPLIEAALSLLVTLLKVCLCFVIWGGSTSLWHAMGWAAA